jgi:hypothetical protein
VNTSLSAVKNVIIPVAGYLSKHYHPLLQKKSPPGRGNARGARRGDKNCAAIVITQTKNGARLNRKFFVFFLNRGDFLSGE